MVLSGIRHRVLRYWVLDTRQLERDIGHGIPGFGNWNWVLKAGHSVGLFVGRLEMNGPGQGTMGQDRIAWSGI